jgi:hypothetical protein
MFYNGITRVNARGEWAGFEAAHVFLPEHEGHQQLPLLDHNSPGYRGIYQLYSE